MNAESRCLFGRRFHVWIAFVFICACAGRVDGYTGDDVRLPANVRMAKHGLIMRIEPTWVIGNGYRPVHVEFSNWPSGPAVADRRIDVEIRIRNEWSGDTWNQLASTSIEIPEGAMQGRATIAIPQNYHWSSLVINAWEGGRPLKECSGTINPNTTSPYSGGWGNDVASAPAFLVIDGDAPNPRVRRRLITTGSQPANDSNRLPDIRGLEIISLQEENAPPPTGPGDHVILQSLAQMPNVEMLAPSDLPRRWIELSSFDIVFISLPDLKTMIAEHPDRWQAIRHWARGGPTLCVYGVGKSFIHLPELERLLRLQPRAESDRDHGNWTLPTSQDFRRKNSTIEQLRHIKQNWSGIMSAETTVEEDFEEQFDNRRVPSSPGFMHHPWGMGQVFAFEAEDIFPGNVSQWNWLFNSITSRKLNWTQRHGFSTQSPNQDFWNFLIPGVGLAPVNLFRVLITLFVIVIGPVNYFLLHRWKRLHLLLVTIPAGATVVTLGLFGWALFADGLGLRTRIRSFTLLDQRIGHAVCWSRQSYYAGLPPSDGLSFPADAVVYEIQPMPNPSALARKRILDWDTEQRFKGGYLQSRVTAQFLVGRSRDSSAGLTIAPAANGNSPLRVKNRLGATIHHLVIHGDDDRYYWAEAIDPGEDFSASPVDLQTALQKIQPFYREHEPQVPSGFDESDFLDGNFFGNMYRPWRYFDTFSEPSMNDSLLEYGLQVAVNDGNTRLEPRSYLAFVECSPEVVVGAEDTTDQASLHLLLGRW